MATLTNEEYDRRKYFLEDLKTLSKTEGTRIFEVLRKNNVEYSENSNGVFFDLVSLSKETFEELLKYMEFCRTVRKDQADRDDERKAQIDMLLR